jgi:GNAT superfamily N-acetyltransferase
VEEYQPTLEENPASEDLDVVSEGLEAYNVAQTGVDDARRLAIFVRDAAGRIVGGLFGMTSWGWMFVDYLWLEEALRGRGYGRRLMAMAEAEAVARGCRQALLNTMSFQAPDFYLELGYEEVAVLEGFAGPHRRHYLKKTLVHEP